MLAQEQLPEELDALKKGHDGMRDELMSLLNMNTTHTKKRLYKRYMVGLKMGNSFFDYEILSKMDDFFDAELPKGEEGLKTFEEESQKLISMIDFFSAYYRYFTNDYIGIDKFAREIRGKEHPVSVGLRRMGSMNYLKKTSIIRLFDSKYLQKLDLSDNDFDDDNLTGFLDIMSAVPSTLRGLDLGNNYIAAYPFSNLHERGFELPEKLEILGWSRNGFSDRNKTDIRKFFLTLPDTLRGLDLSGNQLDKLGNEGIGDMLHMCSERLSDLRDLNLSDNNLGELYQGKLKKIAEKILKKGSQFKDIIQFLPKGLESLNISANRLHRFSIDDMLVIIRGLPSGLKKLDIGENGLGLYEFDDIIKIIKTLPKGLEYLTISENGFHLFTKEQWIEFMKALPVNLKYLNISKTIMDKSSLRLEDLKEIFSHLPESIKYLDLSKSDINYTNEDLGLSKNIQLLDMENLKRI